MMKIETSHVQRITNVVKILADMPFSMSLDTISKPTVLLFDEEDFDRVFPDYVVDDYGKTTYHISECDGVLFECIVHMEDDDD